jgi:ribosome assembly protein YihI (activator of Der GTPase)
MRSKVAREEALGKAKAELLGENVEARLHKLERDEKIDALLQELKQRKQLTA